MWGGEFLQKMRPEFDRKLGSLHNIKDNTVLMRAMARLKTFQTDWRQWWVDALVFDALIRQISKLQSRQDSRATRLFRCIDRKFVKVWLKR